MNATVKRIVDLMFENLQPGDEVQTLHDEVMANCQERFQDCLNRGMTEDEAIGTVIESLKGMEEVLRDYPRRGSEQPEYTYRREGMNLENAFDAAMVRSIQANLTSTDIEFKSSPDHYFRVETEADTPVEAKLNGSTLILSHRNRPNDRKAAPAWNSSDPASSLDDMFAHVFSVFNRIRDNVGHGGGKVTVYMPAKALAELNVNTASGNIRLDDVLVDKLTARTASGDVEADLHAPLSLCTVNTASGDIDLSLDADTLTVSCMSGDIEYRGNAHKAQISSVSGDVELEGCMNVTAKSVSGDVDLNLAVHSSATVNTTSGDVKLHPSNHSCTVYVSSHTTCGKVRPGNHPSAGDYSDIILHANTVSGDIRVDD